jgi:peptide chain release factor subunit 1
VAGIPDLEQLRELAGVRASQGCAVSLYANLDPSVVPTPPDVETKVNSLLDRAERLLEEQSGRLGRSEREGVKADLRRIRAFFDDGFDRQGVRGVAVFAAGLDNFWSVLTAGDPLVDEVRIGADLYLAPFARLAGRGDGWLVAAVGRERGDVYRLDGDRLVEIAAENDEVPGRHDQGGWSQARFERHIDEIVERHWRRVAETLDRYVRGRRGVRVVLVGTEEMRSDFESLLSNEVRGCVVGWCSAEAHADGPALLDAARPVLERWWAAREQEFVDRWREEAAKNGRATAGWKETLEAASDGRVALLLVQDGIDQPAYQCPRCGRAQSTNGSCPLDGTTMESRDGGLDLALHQTLAHGGTVHVLRSRHDLEPVGGLAALLRF